MKYDCIHDYVYCTDRFGIVLLSHCLSTSPLNVSLPGASQVRAGVDADKSQACQLGCGRNHGDPYSKELLLDFNRQAKPYQDPKFGPYAVSDVPPQFRDLCRLLGPSL